MRVHVPSLSPSASKPRTARPVRPRLPGARSPANSPGWAPARRWCCARRAQRAQAERVADLLGATRRRHLRRRRDARADRNARATRARRPRRLGADCAVAIGGGSTAGLGKAIALDSGPAHPRHPDHLRGQRDDADLRPHRSGPQADRQGSRACCRAPSSTTRALTLGLPVGLSVASGINAIAHAAEGLYAVDANPGHAT